MLAVDALSQPLIARSSAKWQSALDCLLRQPRFFRSIAHDQQGLVGRSSCFTTYVEAAGGQQRYPDLVIAYMAQVY